MIVALGSLKGGVGKSTVAINLAATAFDRNQSVLLVDADPTATTLTWGDVMAEQKIRGPTVVAMTRAMQGPGQLTRLASSYDLVVVDCPPQNGDLQRAALAVATVVLLPCAPSVHDVWALGPTAKLVREAISIREAHGLQPLRAYVVINRKKPQTSIGRQVRDSLKSVGLPILQTELCDRVTYQEFLASGRGVTKYQPASLAAREIARLCDEVEGIAA